MGSYPALKGIPVPVDPAIHVDELTYAYPNGPVALDRVSFQVTSGESIGLVGPNGAGKTTLFLCLMGVLPAKSGTVRVVGLDPADVEHRRALPTRAGLIFQNSDDQIFNTTVFDEVAFGPLNLGLPASDVRCRVNEALTRVGLTGLDSRVPFHLSGGEKRRVALAGVLAMQPEVLLMDEPSMSLDPRGRRELIRLCNDLTVTKLIAAHDLEFIRATCRRILLLDAGRIVADGPVRSILASEELMIGHGLEVPHSLTHHSVSEKHHHGELDERGMPP
jgi:cobalt/nickel transport system ATP-binding protein